MKRYYIDFEITAYFFLQEIAREHHIYFNKDELKKFVSDFCGFLNKKGYLVVTKLGDKIETDKDYAAVTQKICDMYTDENCELNEFYGENGNDLIIRSYNFTLESCKKFESTFKNMGKEHLNLFVAYESNKTKKDFLSKEYNELERFMYKLNLEDIKKQEEMEQEQEEEENIALA